jgi:hypothetical protein
MNKVDRTNWSEGKTHRFNCWLERVDSWREKFSDPLTREQAIEVILDEREWDEESGELLGETKKTVCDAVEWQDFGYSFKYFQQGEK